MTHVRDLPDDLFGSHEQSDPDCYGSLCPDCGCCMHCSERDCACTSATCGMPGTEALTYIGA
jgi:hypothetical protein